MQGNVGQQGRDHATLRRSAGGVVKDAFFQITSNSR
jgi:hypothetical protein